MDFEEKRCSIMVYSSQWWEWAEKEDYMVDGMTLYMMGKDFAKKYNSEIVKAFSE